MSGTQFSRNQKLEQQVNVLYDFFVVGAEEGK